MANLPNPRNGSFWFFYGLMGAFLGAVTLALIWGILFVRPADLDIIIKTKEEAAATKKAFDERVVGRTPEGFHRADMREWCEAFAEANRQTGIVCPDPYGLPGFTRRR